MAWKGTSAQAGQSAGMGEVLAQALGLLASEPKRFVDDVLRLLDKIDGDLVPKPIEHPLMAWVMRGVDGLDELLVFLQQADTDAARAAIVGAMGEIFRLHHPTHGAVVAVRELLAATASEGVLNACCQALAYAQDEAFVADLRRVLVGSSPYQAACAARLLAMAGDHHSVPEMIVLLHPGNMVMVDSLVWALGKLQDARALPVLHAMLREAVFVEEVALALGEIGDAGSLVELLRVLRDGMPSHREAAARAVAGVLKKEMPQQRLARVLRASLQAAMVGDCRPKVRFYSAVALAMLGEGLSPSAIKYALCAAAIPSRPT